jgi:hypothetical protein
LEAAFQAVPANRRDSWRLHRLQSDDTFATLGKRYTTTAALVSSANHDALPDAGGLVAIPVAYPGDRVPVRAAAPKARLGARATVGKTTIAKTAVGKTTVSKASAARSTVTKSAAAKSTAAKSTVAKKQAPGAGSPVKGAKVSAPKGSVARAG